MKLSECLKKSENLQLMRFLAAVLVIFSHSYAVTNGIFTGEPLCLITDGQLSFGGFSVSIFFCGGGILIAKSMERCRNAGSYFKARVLRIFPPLIFVVLLSVFALGPWVTEYSLKDYFCNSLTYRYLLNGALILQHDLPGVFMNNPYDSTVNGPLWTLPVEFLCYVACYILWRLRLMEKKKMIWTAPIAGAGGVIAYILLNRMGFGVIAAAVRPSLLFYMGMLFYVYRDRIRLTWKGTIISIAGIVLLTPFHLLDVGMILFFPYILFFFCFALPQIPEKIGKLGAISYGMYLCGFPLQQLLVDRSGGQISQAANAVIAIGLSIIMGGIIYFLVEKPVMAWERKSRRNS